MKKILCLFISTLIISGCSTSNTITNNTDTKILIEDKLKSNTLLGERLVFISGLNSSGGFNNPEIFSLDTKGENKKPLIQSNKILSELSNNILGAMTFSPDFSNFIYFSANSASMGFDIISYDLQKHSRVKLFEYPTSIGIPITQIMAPPTWSLNKKIISFCMLTGMDEVSIFTFDLENKTVKKFSKTKLTPMSPFKPIQISLSPNGDKIAFVEKEILPLSTQKSTKAHIHVVNTDGTDHKSLEFEALYDVNDFSKPFASWSPDGKKIAFSMPSDPESRAFKTMVVNSDLTGLKEISINGKINPLSNVWSNDSSKLLLANYKDSALYTINADGSNEKKITALTSAMFTSYFSSDSKKVIVSIPTGGAGSSINTYTFNSDGTGETKVYSDNAITIGWASSLKEASEVNLTDIDSSIAINNPLNSKTPNMNDTNAPITVPQKSQIIKITSDPMITRRDYVALLECASSKTTDKNLKKTFDSTKELYSFMPEVSWTKSIALDAKSKIMSLSDNLVNLGCATLGDSNTNSNLTSSPTPTPIPEAPKVNLGNFNVFYSFTNVSTDEGKIYSKNILTNEELEIMDRKGIASLQLSADGEKFIFSSRKSGNWEVYITDKNGKNEKNITNDRASDIEPVFSPDGTKVLFTSYNNGDPGIFSIDLNTNNKTKLNTEESDIFQKLKFSPDGRKLIFTRSNNNFEELYIVNSDGSNMKKIASNNPSNSNYEFSNDSQKILFISNKDGNQSISVINSDGSNQKELLIDNSGGYFSNLSFSPDNQKILFQKNERINMMNIDGSNLKEFGSGSAPKFSPDGKSIIFTLSEAVADSSVSNLYIMKIDGSDKIKLTNNSDSSIKIGIIDIR